MKFKRFELIFHYSLTTPQMGTRIKHVVDSFVTEAEHLLAALECSFIYLPLNEDEFVKKASALLQKNGLETPPELAASIQYFINSQLYYTASCAIGGRGWTVEREPFYSNATRHRADLRIPLKTGEYTDDGFNPCIIWFETDHARSSRALYASSRKVLLALGSQAGAHDLFVQFLYRNRDFSGLEAVADTHWRNLLIDQRSLGKQISMALVYITPSHLSAPYEFDRELVLFDGAPRVNDCYFQSWTKDGEFAFMNERVEVAE